MPGEEERKPPFIPRLTQTVTGLLHTNKAMRATINRLNNSIGNRRGEIEKIPDPPKEELGEFENLEYLLKNLTNEQAACSKELEDFTVRVLDVAPRPKP